ncbi:MAG: FAD-dependent thymidylate synthase [Anaerolineales bacterium]|nr:FAD-dependent thymidylate synthase [Anaerolineales bacterium]
MQVELLAVTQRNPALTPETVAGIGDLATIWQGKSNYPENMIEFAGRVCYRSTHRMGTARDFITDRVKEGHEDIIEHIVVTLRVSNTMDPLDWRMLNRHCEVTNVGERTWIVSGNTRVWLDFFRRGIALEAAPILTRVAPAIFAELGVSVLEEAAPDLPSFAANDPVQDLTPLLPAQIGPMRVTLLGYTQPLLDDPDLLLSHGAATFFFEGISRACTHQLVRHRLASFSQESQRYVDLSKGGWQAVVPPAVAANPEAMAELADFWRIAEENMRNCARLASARRMPVSCCPMPPRRASSRP